MNTQKQLVIGDDYGPICGLDKSKGQRLIYLGGDKWRAEKPGAVKEVESQETTANTLAYIRKPTVHMSATI